MLAQLALDCRGDDQAGRPAARLRAHRRGRGAVHLQPDRALCVGVAVPRGPGRRDQCAGRPGRPARSAELHGRCAGLLRRGRCRPHLRRSRRARLGGGRREPDPRPGQGRADLCQNHGTVGTVLNALFQQALRVGKRVQTETGIGSARDARWSPRRTTCSPHERGELAGRRGARGRRRRDGRAGRPDGGRGGCAGQLRQPDPRRAERLAEAVGGRAVRLAELADALARTDVVVTCTGARSHDPHGPTELAGTPVIGVVDLALPADVAAEVTELGDQPGQPRPAGRRPDRQNRTRPRSRMRARWSASEVRDFLGAAPGRPGRPDRGRPAHMASEVVAAEMQPARRPGARRSMTRSASEVQRTCAPDRRQAAAPPTVRVQELSADPDALDYARRSARAVRSRPAGRRRRACRRRSARECRLPAPPRVLRLGARTSPLARAQVDLVARRCWPSGRRSTFVGDHHRRRSDQRHADRDRRHRRLRRRGPGGPAQRQRSTSPCTRSRTCRPLRPMILR